MNADQSESEFQSQVVITLPIPSSKNREPGHWTKRRNLKKLWEEWAFYAWVEARRPKFDSVRIIPVFYFPDRRKRDHDNYNGHAFKGILDGLKGNLVKDDESGLLKLAEFDFRYDKDNPRLELHIAPQKVEEI